MSTYITYIPGMRVIQLHHFYFHPQGIIHYCASLNETPSSHISVPIPMLLAK